MVAIIAMGAYACKNIIAKTNSRRQAGVGIALQMIETYL